MYNLKWHLMTRRPGRRVQPSKWRFLKVFNSPTFKLEGFLKDFDPSILHNWRFLKVLTHFTFKNDYFFKVFKRLHNIWMKSTGCFFTGHTLNNLESKFKGGPLKKHPVDGSIINLLLFSCLFWLNWLNVKLKVWVHVFVLRWPEYDQQSILSIYIHTW